MLKKTNLIDLIVCLTIFSLIFQSQKISLGITSVYYLYFLTIIFIAYYILSEIKSLKELFECKSFVSIAAIGFFIASISQFQSFYINFPITTINHGAILNYPLIKGLTRLLQVFVLFLFSLCIIHYAKRDNLNKIINIHTTTATLLSAFLVLIFIISFFLPNNNSLVESVTVPSEPTIRLTGFFAEPYVLAIYLLTSLPLLLYKISTKFSKYNIVLLFLQSVCLILTFSRAGWLAFLAMLILFAFFVYRIIVFKYLFLYWKYILLLFLVQLFLMFTFSSSMDFAVKLISENVIDAVTPGTGKFWSTKLRLEAYSSAINAFQLHPMLGVGFFNFHFYGGYKFYPEIFGTTDYYYNSSSANNIILTILAETGLIGFLFFIYIWAIIIRKFLRTNVLLEERDKILLKAFFISLICILIMFLFTSNLTLVFMWFYFGLIVAFFEVKSNITASQSF